MAHTLYVIKDGRSRNITQLVGGMRWSSSTDALGVELSFNYAANDSPTFARNDILRAGDPIALFNDGKILHRFIVVTEPIGGRFGKEYNCFDYAWYLNKNQTVIQFKKLSASKAISKLLDRFGIKYTVVPIKTLITKIYKGETVSDILTDILEQARQETGSKYVMEMNIDTLVIRKQSDLVINPMIRLANNLPLMPVVNAIGVPSGKRTIEGMKNKVQVVSSAADSTKIIAEASDEASRLEYGWLTEVVQVDEKNVAQARNIAKTTLADLNRIKDDMISLPLLGHDDLRAGRILEINEPVSGLVGQYLITNANHSLDNGIHLCNVTLGAI